MSFFSNYSRILVTGANGFVGKSLIKKLLDSKKYEILAATRNENDDFPVGVRHFKVDHLLECNSLLGEVDAIIHLAGRAHVMKEKSTNSLEAYRETNVVVTLDLALQAAMAGVKRFIYISSIKVNGEFTSTGKTFVADDIPAPTDPYGISKLEAEEGLKKIAEKYGIELVIIRPVLVYGPGVKANFASMMSWIAKGLPLPLGSATENRRSLVSVDNLTDMIEVCINHSAATNQTFLVSDGKDLSTAELLIRVGQALNKPAFLLPFPIILIKFLALLVGRPSIAQRLTGSLQVDISKNLELLGWAPPVEVNDALRRTASAFLEGLKK